jgi:DNA-binding MarR family transcriptional regulator
MGLINTRYKEPGSGRTQALHLSDKGWTLFNETSPTFEALEKKMLTVLSDGERQILFELMSKVVTGASEWKSERSIDTMTKTEGKVQ